MNYINITDVKPGDYIAVELDIWEDDEQEEHFNGVCYGRVQSYIEDYIVEKDYYTTPQNVFKCFELMSADGTVAYNDTLGANNGCKYRYMTDEEKSMFLNVTMK